MSIPRYATVRCAGEWCTRWDIEDLPVEWIAWRVTPATTMRFCSPLCMRSWMDHWEHNPSYLADMGLLPADLVELVR